MKRALSLERDSPVERAGPARTRAACRALWGLVVEGGVTRATSLLARIPLWFLAGTAAIAWGASLAYAHLDSRFSLDLRVYRAASKSLVGGHNPYQLHFTDYHLPFTYPPAALLAFRPFSLGSVHLIEALWWLFNALAVIPVLYRGVRTALKLPRRQTFLLALVFAPVLSLVFEPLRTNTTYGQINVVLLLLVVVDITTNRWRIGGVLVGMAGAIKLTPLVYLLYFAVRREWRSFIRGAVTFAAIGAAAFAVLPRESRTFWFHQLFDPGRTGTVGSRRNQSWYGLAHRWPFANGSAVLIWAILTLVTVGGTIVLVRRLVLRGHIIDAVVALGLCTELISPISWSHHWVWIVLVPVLVVRGFRGQSLVMASMILLCLVAAIGPYAWDLHGWPGRGLDDSLVLAGALALFTWVISEVRFRQSRSGALTHETVVAGIG
jgi:alpha-1,2-mannosyltransferase